MKKFVTAALCIALAWSITACSKKATNEEFNPDVSDLSKIATIIDRGILTDAVWGVGEEVPPDISCVAGSELTFSATNNPFFVANNDNSDPHFVTPMIITSSLNIHLPAGDTGTRSEVCAAGDLYYIISATSDMPIDIEFRGETCTNEVARPSEPFLFPASGTVTAHVETHEVDIMAHYCNVPEQANEASEEVSENGNPATESSGEEGVEEFVEEEVVEEEVVEEDVVEEDVVEEDVVIEEENPDEVEEEEPAEDIVEDKPRRQKSVSLTKDDANHCPSMMVNMFVLVIDSCTAGVGEVDVEVEAE